MSIGSEINYPKEIWFDVETLLSVAQPSSVTLVGRFPTQFLQDYLAQRSLLGSPCTIQQLSTQDVHAELAAAARADLAIVAGCIEHMDKSTATQLIGRIRDVASGQFCLCISLTDSDWTRNELFALGLKQVATYTMNEQLFALYKYNLADYKKTPDWLNSDNWANPEMWGKYWW